MLLKLTRNGCNCTPVVVNMANVISMQTLSCKTGDITEIKFNMPPESSEFPCIYVKESLDEIVFISSQ